MFKICIMFSSGASALKYLVGNDPNYRRHYDITCAFTDNHHASGIEYVEDIDIPLKVIDYTTWCTSNNVSCRNLVARERYFEEVENAMNDLQYDFIILAGFMLVITKPLLGKYHILNVHPADLRIVDDNGKRKFTGADAVTDAINAGEVETCSTIHLINEEIDGGPIITVSKPLVYGNMTPKDHQECMKDLCDGPAYVKALEMIMTGEFAFPSL